MLNAGDAYPSFAAYSDLYAKYLVGDRTRELIEKAGGVKDLNVVDLCGGGGRLTRMALDMGAAAVCYVDASRDMAEPVFDLRMQPENMSRLAVRIEEVSRFIVQSINPSDAGPDVVFSQQAVNYWLNFETARLLAIWMKPGSVFCFNTFNACPDAIPVPKVYELDGVRYVELSWTVEEAVGTMIEHIQIREGKPAHRTRFRWIPREEYHSILSKYFDVEEHQEGATSVWVCRRNNVDRSTFSVFKE